MNAGRGTRNTGSQVAGVSSVCGPRPRQPRGPGRPGGNGYGTSSHRHLGRVRHENRPVGPQGPRPQALTIRGDRRGKAMLPATRSSLLFGAGAAPDLGSRLAG